MTALDGTPCVAQIGTQILLLIIHSPVYIQTHNKNCTNIMHFAYTKCVMRFQLIRCHSRRTCMIFVWNLFLDLPLTKQTRALCTRKVPVKCFRRLVSASEDAQTGSGKSKITTDREPLWDMQRKVHSLFSFGQKSVRKGVY